MVLKGNLHRKVVRQGDFRAAQLLLAGSFGSFANLFAGELCAKPLIVPAKVVLHRHRQQLGVQRLALLAEGLVPGQQDARHAVIGRHVAVDQKLGGDLAVDPNLLHRAAGDGVAEHVALLTGGVVVAHIHRRVKALIDALHHAARLKGPAADQLHILRHLLRVNVDTRPVRVLDHH